MIEKIIKEINRLKNELDGYSALEALDYIESYINILSRANEDLEEAANQHSKQVFQGLLVEDNITAFKAGAEWQKQQIKEALQTEYEKGRFDMREEIKEQLNNLKDEIQSNLCVSSGFNDEYSQGYQDCGMKVMEMIDKILEL